MNKIRNIAIDGPSGAGKSTIAKRLAKKLDMLYLDTGAMYRAIALAAHRSGLRPVESPALEKLLGAVRLEIFYQKGVQKIVLDGEDVSGAIREHYVSGLASEFSALKSVRLKLVELQRAIAAKNDVILDGRDIGSFVLPDADFKFYLDAAPEVRAGRRAGELRARGQVFEYEAVLRDIIERDRRDMNRDFAPLIRAEDAVYIDSSELSIEAVVERMTEVIVKGK